MWETLLHCSFLDVKKYIHLWPKKSCNTETCLIAKQRIWRENKQKTYKRKRKDREVERKEEGKDKENERRVKDKDKIRKSTPTNQQFNRVIWLILLCYENSWSKTMNILKVSWQLAFKTKNIFMLIKKILYASENKVLK